MPHKKIPMLVVPGPLKSALVYSPLAPRLNDFSCSGGQEFMGFLS